MAIGRSRLGDVVTLLENPHLPGRCREPQPLSHDAEELETRPATSAEPVRGTAFAGAARCSEDQPGLAAGAMGWPHSGQTPLTFPVRL